MKKVLLIIFAIISFTSFNTANAARLKDLADIEGVRGNQLLGYGIVVGLEGTGDKRGANFTPQSMANLLERLGIRVDPKTLNLANVAAVMVTAELPAFARAGTKIDVTLSSMGDAKTLQGGVLLMTPLKGADGNVYAVAQGGISLGGFIVSTAGGDTAQKNHATVARIPLGATVERSIPFDLFSSGQVRIVLREPDFVTVTRVQDAINKYFGVQKARALDSASVLIPLDPALAEAPIQMIARLEQLDVQPDVPARVVVNERTGTIIIGENVRVSKVALAHGNLNLTIRSETQISQPNAFSEGVTAGVTNDDLSVSEEGGQLKVVPSSVSLGEVVKGINSLGATPRDLIAIFQAMKEAGALQAELVIM